MNMFGILMNKSNVSDWNFPNNRSLKIFNRWFLCPLTILINSMIRSSKLSFDDSDRQTNIASRLLFQSSSLLLFSFSFIDLFSYSFSDDDDELLRAAPWFQEGLPRQICEEYLSENEKPIGSFILRRSYTYRKYPFVLSIRTQLSLVEHFLIERIEEYGTYRLQVGQWSNRSIDYHFVFVSICRILRNNTRISVHSLCITLFWKMFFQFHFVYQSTIQHRHRFVLYDSSQSIFVFSFVIMYLFIEQKYLQRVFIHCSS